MATLTPKLSLKKPVPNVETDWAFRLNETIDILDNTTLATGIFGGGITSVSEDGAGNVTITSLPVALVGSDGITVTSGDPTDTISGFRTEFVSASGSLQTQIDSVESSDVDSITVTGTAVTGDVTFSGLGGAAVFADGQIVTISGLSLDELENLKAYGELYQENDSGTALTVVTGNTFTKWTTASVGQVSTDLTVSGSATDDNLTILENGAGEYLVSHTSAVAAGNTNNVWTASIFRNGSRVVGADAQWNFSNASRRRTLGGTSIIRLDPTDTVDLRFRSVAGSRTLTLYRVNLSIARIGRTGIGSAEGGVTDHGNLTGLADDDHAQYSLATGARAFTGTVGGITPTASTHLTTKGYVDTADTTISGHLQSEIDAIDSSVTLQEAYDNGDGIITSTAGKPLELAGDGELLAVTGTFTGGLTVGTSSTFLNNTSITTGSGIFDNSLTLAGDPVVITSTVVSVSGHLQTQIDDVESSDVDDVNSVTGSITIAGAGEVSVSTAGQTITISGTDHVATGGGGSDTAIAGADGITVISGTPTDGEVTVSGFRTEFVNASGTLSTQITTDIATHAAISAAHHSRYTDTEAITALEPTTSALAASGVATDANIVSVSGHLQTEIDAIDSSVTLQDGYDNGDGIVVTTDGKPVDIQGGLVTRSGIFAPTVANDLAMVIARSQTAAHIENEHADFYMFDRRMFIDVVQDEFGDNGLPSGGFQIDLGGGDDVFSSFIVSGNHPLSDVITADNVRFIVRGDGKAALGKTTGPISRFDITSSGTVETAIKFDHLDATGDWKIIDIDVSGNNLNDNLINWTFGSIAEDEGPAIAATRTSGSSTALKLYTTQNEFRVETIRVGGPDNFVGINNSSPTERLHVTGSGIFDGDLDLSSSDGTFTAPTGTFSESLTVSGQPVSIGAGGGADTLQDAFDNGDGIITTSEGKPLELSGKGELLAVSGTFTKELESDGPIIANNIVSLAVGSAGAPSLSFAGDSNTGIYSLGGGNLTFAIDGALKANLSATTWVVLAQLQLNIGSESAPGFGFFGDSDTGMYRPTGNTFSFVTGGKEGMRLSSSQFLGVGTTAPTERLHVVGSGIIDGDLDVTGPTINFANLPTASAGLASGDLWLDVSDNYAMRVTP